MDEARENWNHDYIKIHNFARFIFDSAIIKKTLPPPRISWTLPFTPSKASAQAMELFSQIPHHFRNGFHFVLIFFRQLLEPQSEDIKNARNAKNNNSS